MRRVYWTVLMTTLVAALGCATPAEMRKLQNRVAALERGTGGKVSGGAGGRDRVAEQGAEIEELQRSVDGLSGRIDEMDRQVKQALEEAKAARSEANQAPGTAPSGGQPNASTAPAAGDSQEVQAYRAAHTKWREGDSAGCVDLFGKFLQTYPASEYADDATYWLADCYFKQGNFSAAVLRFDDVARNFPSGDKAPDALYRQGEALLRMGHGTAAGNAFEKVIRDYPNSARAPEAKRQLQILGQG
jgi:tol-pal system protein YbgF